MAARNGLHATANATSMRRFIWRTTVQDRDRPPDSITSLNFFGDAGGTRGVVAHNFKVLGACLKLLRLPDAKRGIRGTSALEHEPRTHTGKLSCFLPGISTVLPRSIAKARAMRGRVVLGIITSST